MSSSISRRINSAIESLQKNDYESSFVHLFPAIDKTAKKRRPRDGVGKRIKEFLRDEEVLISSIATHNAFKNIVVDGIDFPTAMYKFGRTSIAHEGELDERLKINEKGELKIGQTWELPTGYIVGMIISVVVAPENQGEDMDNDLGINLFDKQFKINDSWGKRDIIREHISSMFKDPNLFD